MTVRQTSIQAYTTIRENGLLSKRRWDVYDCLYKHGPLNAAQVWRRVSPTSPTGSFTSRFSELKKMGVVVEVGETKDEVTGMTTILWDVTSKIPEKDRTKIKEPTRNELINNLASLIEIALPYIKNTLWQQRANALLIASSKYRKRKTLK